MESPKQPNILDPSCGSRRVLDVIADKWTMITVYTLARGTLRFGQLQREIGGISQRMLTQTLRDLERDGIVKRTVYPVVPPKVDYSLTSLGETLIGALTAVCHWAEGHLSDIEAARSCYRENREQEP